MSKEIYSPSPIFNLPNPQHHTKNITPKQKPPEGGLCFQLCNPLGGEKILELQARCLQSFKTRTDVEFL